jgi:hypothetical protein
LPTDNWSKYNTLRVREYTEPSGKVVWLRKLPNRSSCGEITEAEARRLIAEEGAVLCEPISSLGQETHSVKLF